MASQTANGKSFEWAMAEALSNALGVPVQMDPSATHAQKMFQASSKVLQARHKQGAKIAIEHILQLELTRIMASAPNLIVVSPDSAGQSGDVRDVILVGETELLGISCKNNHRAFKHSRLSRTIDFVTDWGLSPMGVSPEYRAAIEPIFEMLEKMKSGSMGTAKWRDMPDKKADVYGPILSAFEREILKVLDATSHEKEMCRAFMDYIVGNRDFYKVIINKKGVEILGFNFHGTLNVQKSKYPTDIYSLERDTTKMGTSVLRFQEGHTLAFRLHSASTLIEPSLKFDVQALALPNDKIYTNHINF